MSDFPSARLGSFLRHRKEFFTLDDTARYKRVRVQLHNKGIVLRDIVEGAELRTKQQQAVRAGELLVAEIDAKVGGFGIVPPELDGATVSSHYFLFEVDENQCHRGWLDAFIRAGGLEEQVKARGSTNYAAIRPEHVLDFEIPLPLLPEQRRIVARLEELTAEVEEARGLRQASIAEGERLERSFMDDVYMATVAVYGATPLSQACATVTDGDHLTPEFTERGVPFIFVGNVSRGYLHFHGCKFVPDDYFARLRPTRKPCRGDVLYSAVGATAGVPAIVDCERDFCFQRHVAIMKPDRSLIDTRFLWYMLRSRSVYSIAWKCVTGSAQPTIPLHAISALPIPVPPLRHQGSIVVRLDAYQAKITHIRNLQAETAAEFDTLLPSVLNRAFKGAF